MLYGLHSSIAVRYPVNQPTIAFHAILILGMVLVSDLGLLSTADGIIYALLISLLFPSMPVYFLITICTYQDAAGLSVFWWYAGTVLFSAVVVVQWIKKNGIESLSKSNIGLLYAAVLCVISYAILVSMLQTWLGGHPQSDSRPPIVVGGLMVWMSLAGIATASLLFDSDEAKKRLRILVFILIANGLFVAVAKAAVDLEVFASPEGMAQVQEARQLIEPSALGIPRLIGTYLTPNGFALCYGLLLLFLLVGQGSRRISDNYAYGYVLIAILLALFSFSKAMAIFFAITSAIFLWQSQRAKYVIGLGGLLALFSAFAYFDLNVQTLLEAYRVPAEGSGELGYRGEAWALVTQTFSIADWTFGTGLSYWPHLFESNLGYSLSDPHTYLLSVPGTYGLLGVAVYILLGVLLLKIAIRQSGARQGMALSLVTLLFIKDLVSIPYLIGNTPLTLMIWALLAATIEPCTSNEART